MASVPSSGQRNFDPTNYNTGDYKKKDGTYQLTDYQAALTVRNWLHKNMPGQMIDRNFVTAAAQPGATSVTTPDGKTIPLTEQERAAFDHFRTEGAALFNRLDAGENGTHDELIGEWDIDAAIKNGRLHGAAQSSANGYWRNRNDDMPPAEAADAPGGFLSEKLGSDWTLSREDLRRIADVHTYWDKDKGRWLAIDNPDTIRAAGVLLDNWEEIQIGEGNSVGTLSREELEKLKSL